MRILIWNCNTGGKRNMELGRNYKTEEKETGEDE
jgi:hypothetical protein